MNGITTLLVRSAFLLHVSSFPSHGADCFPKINVDSRPVSYRCKNGTSVVVPLMYTSARYGTKILVLSFWT